jgi:hypothetical protein
MEMRANRIESYWDAMLVIEAQETLIACKLQDFSHLKQQERREWHRQLHRKAYPNTWEKPISTQELAQRLRFLNG